MTRWWSCGTIRDVNRCFARTEGRAEMNPPRAAVMLCWVLASITVGCAPPEKNVSGPVVVEQAPEAPPDRTPLEAEATQVTQTAPAVTSTDLPPDAEPDPKAPPGSEPAPSVADESGSDLTVNESPAAAVDQAGDHPAAPAIGLSRRGLDWVMWRASFGCACA